MAAFQRPGTRTSSAWGLAFASDRTSEESGAVSAAALQLQQQQQQTPAQRQFLAASGSRVGKHQQAVLHAVEHHATTVLVSDDAAGEHNVLCGKLQAESRSCSLQRAGV